MKASISQFLSILNTNHVPTDEQVLDINHFLTEVTAKGIELEDRIAKVSLELQALQEQQEEHKRLVSQHRALLSPIRRIPEEILTLIFLCCLPTTHNAVMSATQAPILLTHVCQGWRTLALGIQDLWSSIYISIPTYPDPYAILRAGQIYGRGDNQYPEPLAGALALGDWDAMTGEPRRLIDDALAMRRRKMTRKKELIVEWLQRAGPAKLSITIIQWSPLQPDHFWSLPSGYDPVVMEIVGILKAYASQWKAIELTAFHDIVDELLSLPATDTPNIEAVKIASGFQNPPFGTDTTPWDGSKVVRFLSKGSVVTSPTLHSLNIQSVRNASLESIPICWKNLTKLVFCGYPLGDFPSISPSLTFTPSQALDLLEKCPNLVECGMAIGSMDHYGGFNTNFPAVDQDDSSLRQVTLQHLNSLWVHEETTYPLNSFFACLDIPRLSSLKFITNRTPRTPPSPPTGTDDAVLSMQAVFPTRPWYPPSLPVLLRTCGATIKSLEFDYTYQTNESLQDCLSLVPDVEDLRLSIENEESVNLGVHDVPGLGWNGAPDDGLAMAYMDDDLFERLFIPSKESGRRALCPKMSSLFIALAAAGLTEEKLLEFVKARRSTRAQEFDGISHLKSLRVVFATESESAREKRRRELTRRGLNWVTNTKWIALEELEGLPDVILEGFKAKVTWPLDPALENLLHGTERMSVKGPWSPTWGLEKVTSENSLHAIGECFREGI